MKSYAHNALVILYPLAVEFNGTRCENDISTECLTATRCEHNGTCHNRKGGFTCICPAAGGYSNDE